VAAAQLTVTQARDDQDVVLRVTGEIDISTSDRLLDAARGALAMRPVRLVLDVGAVTFCDSQGLSVLIGLKREAQAAGTRLVLSQVGGFLARLLEITGLRAAFDRDEAAFG
jgi:anti-sigma B factor antagonist